MCMSCSRPCTDRSGIRSLRKRAHQSSSICGTQQAGARGATADRCSSPRDEGMPGQPGGTALARQRARNAAQVQDVQAACRQAGERTSARLVAVVVAPAPLAVCRQHAQESGQQQALMHQRSAPGAMPSVCQDKHAVRRSRWVPRHTFGHGGGCGVVAPAILLVAVPVVVVVAPYRRPAGESRSGRRLSAGEPVEGPPQHDAVTQTMSHDKSGRRLLTQCPSQDPKVCMSAKHGRTSQCPKPACRDRPAQRPTVI